MVIGCFSLSHVSDDEHQAKASVRSKRRGDPNKRLKKSRIKDRFKNAFSRRSDDDPLSLVGCEFSVREYPLAVLENRNGCKSNAAAGLSPRQERSPGRRRSPRLKNKIHDDEEEPLHNLSPRHKCSPRPNDKTSNDKDEEEERLIHLQNIVYKNLKCSFSEETIASVRSRGLDEIGDMLTPSSHLSNLIQQSIHNTYSHHAQHVRRMVLKKIHGKTRSNPLCPNCFGNLTYRYISKKGQHIFVCDILAGRDHTKEKLQNLLPPLCEKCETHLIYEHCESKLLLMENFGAWLESGFDEDSDLEEQRQDHESGYRSFNDPLNAKIMVVPKDEPSNEMAAQISPLTFGDPRIDYPTPRRSNSSCSEQRELFPQFGFDGTDAALDNPVFSGLSDLSTKTYRRKGQIGYMDTENAEGVKHQKKLSDANHREEVVTPANDEMSLAIDSAADESNGVSEDSRDSYSSDEDPFSEMHSVDEMTVFGRENSGCDGSDCSEISDTGKKINEQAANVAEIPPVNSSLVQSSFDKTSESVDSVNTESEERVILERYSMKKEVATKQIAKDLIRGRELTASECDRCGMPLMKKDDTLECVVCPAIQRQAKRTAKQKRKVVELTKCVEQQDLPLGGVEENGGDKREEGTDDSSRSFTYDLIYAALEKKDDTGTTQSFLDAKLNKDSISLAILEETRLISALEEGQLGYDCSDENGPFLFLGECSEGINYGSKRSADNPPPRLYLHSSSSSVSLNPNVTKQTARDSIACSQSIDSSWYSATRQPSIAISSYSSRSSSASHPAVEHTLGSYEVITRQYGLPPPFRSFSNQYLGSISEVSEPRAGPRVKRAADHYGGSSSDVSGQHVASPHCTSSETMFQNNQSNHTRSQFQGSSSEVSACEYPRLPSSSETNQLQYYRSTTIEDQSSTSPEARDSRTFPPNEMPMHENQQHLTTKEEIQPHHSLNSQRKHSLSEDSVHSVPPEENQYTASELTLRQRQLTLATSEKQLCHSQSDESETQCPRNLPSSEMIHGQCPPNETAGIIRHGLNSERLVSVSDVSVNQRSPKESIQCPSHNDSHRNQLELASSEESNTRCPHSLPSGKIIRKEVIGEMKLQVDYCQNSHCGCSMSEVTMIHSDISSTKCPRDLAASDMIYPSFQPNAAIATEKLPSSEELSEESLTQCPRDLPSNEMIWNYEYGGSQPNQVRPALDQGWVAREVNTDEREEMGLHPQHPLPEQMRLGARLFDGNGRCHGPAGWRDQTLDVNCDPQKASSENMSDGFGEQGGESLQREMCKEECENTIIPTNEINTLKEDSDAMPSQGTQAWVTDNGHNEVRDICHQNSASLANTQSPVEIIVPVKAAKEVKTDEHSKSDPPKDEDGESLSDRIRRLESSLRDVAGRLPQKDDCQHKDIETGNQRQKSPPLEKTGCLYAKKQQRTPDDLLKFISPSVSENKKIDDAKYETNQIDGSQCKIRCRLGAAFEDRDQRRVPSKENNDLSKVMAGQKPPESQTSVSCLYPPPQSENLISISVSEDDQIKKNYETKVGSENTSLERTECLDERKQKRTPVPRNLIPPSIKQTKEIGNTTYEANQMDGSQSKVRGRVRGLFGDRDQNRVPSKEKKDNLGKPPESYQRVLCHYPSLHSDTPILARDNDQIENNDETIKASETYTLHHKPLLSPVLKECGSPYIKYNHSFRRRFKRSESLPPVTASDSAQPSINLQHTSYTPSPMNSLHSSNSLGQPSKGTLIHYHPSQNEQRSDPPGHRIESSGGKHNDPPGTPSGYYSTRINVIPKSKRKIPSPNVKIPHDSDDEVATPRGDSEARDPSPKNTEDDPHPYHPVHNSTTPKFRQRPNPNMKEPPDDDNKAGTPKDPETTDPSPKSCEDDEPCPDRSIQNSITPKPKGRRPCTEGNTEDCNETSLQTLQKDMEMEHVRERGQYHLLSLRNKRERQQHISNEETRRFQEDQQRLQEERDKKKRIFHEEEKRKQHLRAVRGERELHQRMVQEETRRMKEEQRHLQEEMEEEERLLGETESEQQHLQTFREERERQQRIIQEEKRRFQEEQRRLQDERDEKKRIFQQEEKHEEKRLRVLREERKRQQRIVLDETRRIQEEQRRLQEVSEARTRMLQEEGEREQQRLRYLREERQGQQRVPQDELRRHQEERQFLQEWEQKQKTLPCESSVVRGSVRRPRGEIKSHAATSPSSDLHSEVNEYNIKEIEHIPAAECESGELPQNKLLQEETGQLNSPPWVRSPIERKNSWGESSLNDLFRQIDEIEDDFHTIIASLPSSEGQTVASSIKDSTFRENESPKRKSGDEHSLFEITLNNAGSFESNASRDSMVIDVMQRMRRIKDCIERIDSVDDDCDRSVSSQSYDSQGEMSQLILRLTNAAAELRTFHEWDD